MRSSKAIRVSVCQEQLRVVRKKQMKRSAASPVESEKSKDPRVSASPQMAAFRPPRSPPRRQMAPTSGLPIPEEGHLLRTEAAIRNNFTVDILKMNGEDFRARIVGSDAVKLIFVKALGFRPQQLASVVPGYRGTPSVLFKLHKSINIDEVFKDRAEFSFIKRIPTKDGQITETYDCSIRGVRVEGQPSQREQRYTFVKIEGTDYQVELTMLKKWLLEFGTLMSDVTEDKLNLDLSSDEEEMYEGCNIATGVYSVKMALTSQIPQFLPIDGKKVKIYYRGMKKQCLNCFNVDHKRADCTAERVDWLAYVNRFMLDRNIPMADYGKWFERVEDWRLKNTDEHQKQLQEVEELKTAREHRRAEGRVAAREIADLLSVQNLAQKAKHPTAPEPPSRSPAVSVQDESNMSEGDDETPINSDCESTKKMNDGNRTPKQPEQQMIKGTNHDQAVEKLADSLNLAELEALVEKKKRGRPTKAEVEARGSSTKPKKKN